MTDVQVLVQSFTSLIALFLQENYSQILHAYIYASCQQQTRIRYVLTSKNIYTISLQNLILIQGLVRYEDRNSPSWETCTQRFRTHLKSHSLTQGNGCTRFITSVRPRTYTQSFYFGSTKKMLITTRTSGSATNIMIPNVASASEVSPTTDISSAFMEITFCTWSGWNLCSHLT